LTSEDKNPEEKLSTSYVELIKC